MKYTNLTFTELVNKIGSSRFFDLPSMLKEALTRLANTPSYEPPYKVYTALLSQEGTDAPVATVLENTLGGIPTFTYDGVGVYTITLTGLLTANKRTFNVFTTRRVDGANGETIEGDEIHEDDNRIQFITFSDDISGAGTPANEWTKRIEIRVYN